MNRKTFLKHSVCGCLGCCGLLAAVAAPLSAQEQVGGERLSDDLRRRMVSGAKAPDWRRLEKALFWIQNMLDQLDRQLDEATRIRLLEACGRSCFIYSRGVADERKPTPEAVEGFFRYVEKAGFPVKRNPDSIVIEFGYQGEQNPQGLSIKEGYCMCPIVETETPGLSPSYCHCSAGYVKELVERYTGMSARKAEILESVKRGGKDCRFRLELVDA